MINVEASTSYYRARYYDPQAGRFSTEDPARFRAGGNFYRYVRNDPTNLADPFGLNPAVGTLPWLGPWWRPIEGVVAGVGAAGAAVLILVGEAVLAPATAMDDVVPRLHRCPRQRQSVTRTKCCAISTVSIKTRLSTPNSKCAPTHAQMVLFECASFTFCSLAL